jgi:hypothetical protein
MSLCAIALIAPPWLPVPPPSYGGVEAVWTGWLADSTQPETQQQQVLA